MLAKKQTNKKQLYVVMWMLLVDDLKTHCLHEHKRISTAILKDLHAMKHPWLITLQELNCELPFHCPELHLHGFPILRWEMTTQVNHRIIPAVGSSTLPMFLHPGCHSLHGGSRWYKVSEVLKIQTKEPTLNRLLHILHMTESQWLGSSNT